MRRSMVAFWLFLFFALGTVSVGSTALENGHDLGGLTLIGMGLCELALAGWFVHRRK